jgi:hypothetical protein
MPDPIAASVAFLLSDAPLVTLVGSRVFGGELPAREAEHMPRAAVVLKPAGGGLLGTGTIDVGDTRLDVDCYGATPLDAWTVYLAVYGALKGLTRGAYASTVLHWARPSSRGTLARDPDTDWPVTVSSWQVLAGESTP